MQHKLKPAKSVRFRLRVSWACACYVQNTSPETLKSNKAISSYNYSRTTASLLHTNKHKCRNCRATIIKYNNNNNNNKHISVHFTQLWLRATVYYVCTTYPPTLSVKLFHASSNRRDANDAVATVTTMSSWWCRVEAGSRHQPSCGMSAECEWHLHTWAAATSPHRSRCHRRVECRTDRERPAARS